MAAVEQAVTEATTYLMQSPAPPVLAGMAVLAGVVLVWAGYHIIHAIVHAAVILLTSLATDAALTLLGITPESLPVLSATQDSMSSGGGTGSGGTAATGIPIIPVTIFLLLLAASIAWRPHQS